MKYEDMIADLEARDPEFKRLREEGRPAFEFSVALIGARLAAGLSQAEVAELIGTKQSAISRLENGTSNPTLDMMARLAGALSVTFEITRDRSVKYHLSEPVVTPDLEHEALTA